MFKTGYCLNVLSRPCQLLCVCWVSSVSLMISSMGFGGEVFAIVKPIHAPIDIMPMNAMVTGVAISQKWTSAAAPMFRNWAMWGS